MIVNIGCKPMSTKTKPSDSVAASACAKHHEPPIPPRSIIPIRAFMFFIFLICSRLNKHKNVNKRIQAMLVSRAISKFPLRGVP